MAESVIDSLVVLFKLDAKGFKTGADQIEDATKRTGEKSKKAFGDLEEGAKKAGQGFRSVATQAFGMFLAFQGASTLTGMISGMLTTAASADRMASALGTSTGKVIAWRMAMKNVGGTAQDADQAFKTIAGIQQDWLHGMLGGQQAAILSSFGINQKDLRNAKPEDILEKLAGAKRPYGNAEYANRLQQLGLSDSAIYFLMQGQSAVKAQTQVSKQQIDEYKKEAKAAEDMQKNLAELNKSIADLLIPQLNKLIPILTDLVGTLNSWLNPGKSNSQPGTSQSPLGVIKSSAPENEKDAINIQKTLVRNGINPEVAEGIAAGIYAEGGSWGRAANGAFGKGQWLGGRAKELFKRFGPNPSPEQQIQYLLWELRGGEAGGSSVLNSTSARSALYNYITHFMRPQGKNWEYYKNWAGDMARGQGYLWTHSSNVTIHVDARGHQNPHTVEQAARRGVQRAMVTQASRTTRQ